MNKVEELEVFLETKLEKLKHSSPDDAQIAYLEAVIRDVLSEFLRNLKKLSRSKRKGCSHRDILQYINNFEQASKGKLGSSK